MNNKIFNHEKYGMVICPYCNSHDIFKTLNVNVVQSAGVFGFIRKEGNTFNQKEKPI